MKRTLVLGHARLSWGEQDSNSPARQTNAIRAWAAREGFSDVEIYADVEGRHSGRKNEGRPEWARLLQRLETDPTVAVVAVESVDRLFRNLKLLQHFVDDCTARGVRFVSIAENFDFKPPAEAGNPLEEAMRRLALQQFGALAEAWSNMTSAKMKLHVEAKYHKAQHWGRCPFGTELDRKGKLTAAADTYPALAELYSLYAQRIGGWAAVAERLNEMGYTARDKQGNPRPFTRDDVRMCLDMNLTYAGHIIKGRSQSKGGPTILVENAWEPIIPMPLLRAAVVVKEAQARKVSTPERRNVYPLTPLLRCSMCGQALVGQRETLKRGGQMYYRHHRKGKCRSFVGQIHADNAERLTRRLIADLVPPPSTWDLLEEALSARAHADPAARDKAARIEDLRARKQRLKEMYFRQVEAGVEVMTVEELAARLKGYDDQIGELEAGLQPAFDPARFRGVLARLADINKLLERAHPQTRQEVYRRLFEQIDISLSTGSVSKYVPRDWLKYYVYSVIECAWREPNPAFTEQLQPLVGALALAA